MAHNRTSRRFRLLGGVAVAFVLLGFMPSVAQARIAPPEGGAKRAHRTFSDLKIQAVNARTSGSLTKGAPIPSDTNYQWMITADDTGNPDPGLIKSVCSSSDPNYPANCPWPSIRNTGGNVPVVAQGDQTKLGPTTPLSGLAPGSYLISVMADGYQLGGVHFTMPLADTTNGVVQVPLEETPIPTGTLRVRVFHDNAPVDATYEAAVETGGTGPGQVNLSGFEAHLTDVLGLVTTDWYGNPLCTNYVHDLTGKVVFDDTGSPVIDPNNPGGHCYSDAQGDIVIPNLGSDRYGVSLSKPADKKNWVQTTTLEGQHDHDVWVSAGDTGLDTEMIIGGEPVPWVQFGYIEPKAAPVDAQSTAHITGQVLVGLAYVGGNGGVTMPGGTGTAGGKEGPPIDRPWISLSDLGNGDQMVYTGRGNADGTFDIAGVPDGTYQLTEWDDNQDYILNSFNVTVKNQQNVDTGKTYLSGWTTRIYGDVFIDSNGNGKRDPGEQGVPGLTLTLRERDNSLMDQMANAVKTNDEGAYKFDEAYPLTKWIVLENFQNQYQTTGITVQAENDPKPTTFLGAAVDVNILPVLGLGGRVDWGVKPYDPGTNGGIVGTVTYDTTRNELDPKYAVTEAYQPGIPGIPVHLWSVKKDANGDPILDSRGLPQKDAEIASTYTSETWSPPSDCVARQWDGTPLTQTLDFLPKKPGQLCVESPAVGWQARPADTTPGNFSQTVNGNYGFGTSDLNQYAPGDPNNPGYPVGYADAHPTECAASPTNCAPGNNDLPLNAPLAQYGYSPQSLANGDYIVTIDIPKNPVGGGDMYQVTKEQDVNIFSGDTYLPQENFPLSSNPATNPPAVANPAGTPEAPPSMGAGMWADCVGPDQTVHVTNPDFIAGGGSPFEGQNRPLCNEKLVTVRGQQSVSPNFNLYTPVPMPTHFYGLTINDLGLTWDKKSSQYGEAQGLPNIPMGIYDWAGQLVDTVNTDYNGWYEGIEPSTSSYNCPLPAGPCPNMYRFVGNDPGQPGHPNPNYNPRYRSISANFQAWPGLFTVTDTAPTQTGAVVVTPGTTTPVPVNCSLSASTPEVFAVDKVIVGSGGSTGDRTVTVKGRGFGLASAPTVQLVKQSAINADGTVNSAGVLSPTITNWSDTQIQFVVPNVSVVNGIQVPNGPLQLRIQNATSKLWSSSAITINETNVQPGTNPPVSASWNPAVLNVGPGQTYSTIQSAINASLSGALGRQEFNYGRIVVVYPGNPTTFNPSGAYLENPIINRQLKLQGFGPGGIYADGTAVPGSVIDGSAYDADGASGTAWNAIANGPHAGPVGVPDGAVVTVEPRSTGQFTQSTTSLNYAAVDGFRITGGYQQNVPGNLNAITGGNNTGFGGTGAQVTQGGGIYVHAYARNLHLSNNLVIGNSGSYGGGIRVGTPYAAVRDNQNDFVKISFNRIRDNGGTNLAGGVGLFTGTQQYRFDHNDVCGNFSSEYGGGISVFGVNPNGSVSGNRFWFNESYDEGGGVFFGGELTADPNALSAGTGPQTVNANEIVANNANDDGGGLRLLMVNNALYKVTNNIIADNVSTHEGGGVALDDATNVSFIGDTVARNITTATAVTSNGHAAAAGLSTGANSAQLQATLPAGAPTFSKPVLLNDIFWQNKAGSWNGLTVTGIGIDGTGTENFWDMGSIDGSGPLQPRHSILTTPNSGQETPNDGANLPGTDVPLSSTALADPFDTITQVDPFISSYSVFIDISTLRSFPGFRQSVIVVNNLPPDSLGNYHLASTATVPTNLGVALYNFGTVASPINVTAPQFDIDGQQRYTLPATATQTFDAGADQR